MKIEKLMTSHARTCRPGDDLRVPAREMWEGDCGSIPVVDASEQVVGMITDRDICMAAFTQDRPLSQLRVQDVMSRQVLACQADDDVAQAEELMRRGKVRRLPVLDHQGRLEGVISINDLALAAAGGSQRRATGIAREDVADVLAAVSEHRGATLPESAQRQAARR